MVHVQFCGGDGCGGDGDGDVRIFLCRRHGDGDLGSENGRKVSLFLVIFGLTLL